MRTFALALSRGKAPACRPRVPRRAPEALGEALLEDCALHPAGRLMLDGWQGGDRAQFCIIDFALEASRAQL
jgi:hypothetical protein